MRQEKGGDTYVKSSLQTRKNTYLCAHFYADMAKKGTVLVTGASGFIGHCFVELLLKEGYSVSAGVRLGSKTDELQRMGAELCVLNMDAPDALRQSLCRRKAEQGAWDYIIHAAGLTKARRKEDFERVNCGNTQHFVRLLMEEAMIPRKFIFISSLSVYGPLHECDGLPFDSRTDVPSPNTAYGRSKLHAEEFLLSVADRFPAVILRPTGVYGPREKDYFLMAKSVCRHIDVGAGFRPQILTFIYGMDVAHAALLAMERPTPPAAVYDLSDGGEYSSSCFSRLLQRELGVRGLLRFCVPLWMLWLVSWVSQTMAGLTGTASTLNLDKFRIMKQRSWRCSIEPARKDLGYEPQYLLDKGVAHTVRWYKKEGWL